MKRLLSICLATLLALGLSVVPLPAQPAMADPGDIYVPGDYPAIQQGINAATSGDTVHVAAGTYYEHITIDKPLILLGEDRETTIIDGGGTGNVVYVAADHVEISGFTVQNSGSAHFQFHYWGQIESGIFLGESSYSKITDCDVRNGGHGISLQYHSDYNLVENCNAYSNTWNGIMLGLWSSHSVIINCNMWNNNSEGIGLWDWGRNNTISNCNAYSNTGNGIGIHWHRNTVVENCNAWNNGYAGIGFDSTMYCKVENANSYSNYIGVLIYTWGSTRYNTITGCDIYSNTYGILVYDPAGHPYGGNNMIYHNNVIDNTYQAKDGNSYPNTWDDGYPSGGNYWSDYIGVDNFSGPGQNLPGSDGIGDTPYVFDGNQDNYPLMEVQNYMVAQCVATATGTGTACFTSSHGIIVELTAMATPPRAPAVLPHGMFSFNISCIDPRQTVTVTIELPERVPVGTEWWKYQAGSWYSLPIGSDNGDNIITITLTDGVFPGDTDNIDGQITDPGGPGYHWSLIVRGLIISSTEGGRVTKPGEGHYVYDPGTIVKLVATPDDGYRFVEWTGDVRRIDDVNAASTTITMTYSCVITANFEAEETSQGETQVQYELSVSSTMGGSVSSPGEGTFAYGEGSVVSLVASPDFGYEFVNWTGDGITHPDSATTTVTMNGDHSVKANFEFEETPTTDSTEGPSGSMGCFIATAAYGTPTAEQIDVLREFRDVVLLENSVGSQFVALYYQLSPPVADFIAGNSFLRTLVRELLVDPVVWIVEATGNIWRN